MGYGVLIMKTSILNRLLNVLILTWMLTLVLFSNAEPEHHDIVVIVNAHSPLTHLSRDEIAQVYTARMSLLADGTRPVALDLQNNPNIRNHFYANLLHTSSERFDAFWARLLFTGLATPPKLLSSQDQVVNEVLQNDHAIGFVTDDHVKSPNIHVLARWPQ